MIRMSASAEERIATLSKEKTQLLQRLLEERSREVQRIKPVPRDGAAEIRLPTSWAQQRLWFIDQLEGRSEAYHIAVAFRLEGTLDQEALQKALNTVAQRHEALHTTFVNTDGDPQQQIVAANGFALAVFDLSVYEHVEREEQIQRHKIEEARTRFDLRTGPLIRGRLLRTQPHEHVLLITMHHIVSDGWSMGVFTREVSQLYTAYRAGHRDPLPLLPIQYADYAQWQRQWLQGEVLDRQLGYWRERLQNAAPQLELPADRPRPPVQSYRGENVPVVLDAQLCAELKSFAQRHEITLFMLLYAGWAILLSRLSGQEDVIIGTPVSNRQRPELEGLIGFFVNTLALRTDVRGELRVAELIEQVREVTLGAYGHQDVPFEKIVEALQPERSLSRNPLFQVMLSLQSAPKSELQMPGLTATLEDEVYESAMFDLMLSLEQRGDEIAGNLNYATDLFDRRTVERWIACFRTLLKAITEDSQIRVGELPVLPETERRQVVEVFNATQTAYTHEKLIHELFEEQVEHTPSAVALVYEEESLTYVELNRKANQLAQHLRQQGVGPDQLVAICVERGLAMVVALLGILKAGGAYLPLDPNYPGERLQYMLEDAAPQVVVTQHELRAKLPPTQAPIVELNATLREVSASVAENLPAAAPGLSPQHLVYVIYTSGSTGRPKGTAMAHRSMVNLIEWHRQYLPAHQGTRVLQFAALSFDVAFQEIFSTLCTGGTLVLLREWTRRDPQALTEFLTSHCIERLFVPPLMLQSLAEYCKASRAVPMYLRDVVTAGEQLRISAEVADFFKQLRKCRLHNHYGPTETHVVTASTLSGNPDGWPSLPTIGRPLSNTQVYVLDRYLQPAPIGVSGELYIGGDQVARGYLRRSELTAQRFVGDRFSADPQARMYKTGDLGRWRADGTLEYLGRNDDQVKIRGFRIEPGEIEAQLARHDGVKEVAVVAREDVPGEKRLVAYVVRRDESGLSVENLREQLKVVLPEHMVPSAFVIVDRLPLTPSGKLDRRSLPAPDAGAYVRRHHEAPLGDTEESLAEIWRELLQVEQIGRQDNFFELGGHSLLGVKLVARVRERFMIQLPVMVVFRCPTIRQMSEVVAALQLNHGERLTSDVIEFDDGTI